MTFTWFFYSKVIMPLTEAFANQPFFHQFTKNQIHFVQHCTAAVELQHHDYIINVIIYTVHNIYTEKKVKAKVETLPVLASILFLQIIFTNPIPLLTYSNGWAGIWSSLCDCPIKSQFCNVAEYFQHIFFHEDLQRNESWMAQQNLSSSRQFQQKIKKELLIFIQDNTQL